MSPRSSPVPVPPSALAGADETVLALQDALATEHAAIWAFTLVAAFLPAELDRPAADAATAHRARRDAVSRLLTDAEVRPVAAQPAYQPPEPVTDSASAVALAVVAEADVMAAWRSVLQRTEQPDARRLALGYLTDSAVRSAAWRTAAGLSPAVPDFPGTPG